MSLRVFVTAFEPYEHWSENASWQALVEFTKSLAPGAEITTRLYPVDFQIVRQRLEQDLAADFDYALHVGQAPGSTGLRLESVGINIGGNSGLPAESYAPLVDGGPTAYQSGLPLGKWVQLLRKHGIPAAISYHAGTYLCNATLYLTHYLAETQRLRTKAAFIHVPLTPSQAIEDPGGEPPFMSPESTGRALGLIVESLVNQWQHDRELA